MQEISCMVVKVQENPLCIFLLSSLFAYTRAYVNVAEENEQSPS